MIYEMPYAEPPNAIFDVWHAANAAERPGPRLNADTVSDDSAHVLRGRFG
jgi:hypothetical protein